MYIHKWNKKDNLAVREDGECDREREREIQRNRGSRETEIERPRQIERL